MEIEFFESSEGLRVIKLKGRLDIAGAGRVETTFSGYCAGEHARVVVDLSAVDYIASIGIRLLVTNAKSLASRHGKMALINLQPEPLHVLELAGIPSVIPIYSHMESAETVLLSV